jgi:glycine betaine/proline transport system substrate-binding protein
VKAKKRVITALATSALLALTACGSSDDGGSDAGGTDTGGGGSSETIKVGIIPSWTDYKSMGYLWKALFEEQGYSVDITELQDNAPLYAGLAKGDVDMMGSSWPEVTQKSYWDQYKNDIEDLDTWYDNAKLTMAVPEYSNINSIEDLAGNAGEFDGKIVGIEAGAGLTKVVKENVMPEYGLNDNYELVTSSTTAMLAELKKATDAQKEIVVTLWRPFWANTAFPVKDLEDPKGALGESEGLHVLGRTGFEEDYPDLAAMVGKVTLDDEQYGALEDLVANTYPDDPEKAVNEWMQDNQDWVDSLQS